MSARWFGLVLCAGALVVTPACSGDKDEGCTDSYSYAAVVTIVDANGAAVPNAHVTYSQNGGATRDAACAVKACTSWNVEGGGGGSSDQSGTYLIRATSPDGTKSAEQTINVTANACGQPFIQRLTLTVK